MFDTKEIVLRGGSGGNGAITFVGTRSSQRGAADGGDGGDGGSVLVATGEDIRSLRRLARVSRITAGDGGRGSSRGRVGAGGKGTVVQVPIGTVVWEMEEGGKRVLLADLASPGLEVAIARGGQGGRGNKWFGGPGRWSSWLAEGGDTGEERQVLFEVKSMCDAAMVGMPNAGKSALLGAVSGAKPVVAAYPFTTVDPDWGVVERRGRRVVLADLPPIVEGARQGRGLGMAFLRHAERAQVLVQVVDGLAEDWATEYAIVAGELEAYGAGVAEKPRIVVVNKVDLAEVRARQREEAARVRAVAGREPLRVAAATGEGLDDLLDALVSLVREERPSCTVQTTLTEQSGEQRTPEGVTVAMDGPVFVVQCRRAERFMQVVNLNNWHTRLQFHRELKRLGVVDALDRKGIQSGDTVRIGSYELEWQ